MATSRLPKSTHSKLYHKLSRALAEGADVTIVWIQTIVTRAKQQWQIKSLQKFLKNLQVLATQRGILLHADVIRITKNCWLYLGA
jgi:tryptophanase